MGDITNCQSLQSMFKRVHMVIAICMVKDVGYRIIIEATYSTILRDTGSPVKRLVELETKICEQKKNTH